MSGPRTAAAVSDRHLTDMHRDNTGHHVLGSDLDDSVHLVMHTVFGRNLYLAALTMAWLLPFGN